MPPDTERNLMEMLIKKCRSVFDIALKLLKSRSCDGKWAVFDFAVTWSHSWKIWPVYDLQPHTEVGKMKICYVRILDVKCDLCCSHCNKKKFTKSCIRAKGGKTELKPFSLQSEFSHRHLKFEVKVSVVSSWLYFFFNSTAVWVVCCGVFELETLRLLLQWPCSDVLQSVLVRERIS